VSGNMTRQIEELADIHLLDLEALDLHAADNVRKQSNHVVIAHGHVGNDLLESDLLGGVVLILFTTHGELLTELSHFPLSTMRYDISIQSDLRGCRLCQESQRKQPEPGIHITMYKSCDVWNMWRKRGGKESTKLIKHKNPSMRVCHMRLSSRQNTSLTCK